MRLKKGFTFAEILIVLMVIGALATMTIPSLMKGVQEAQWKTAYKKAYNAIVNLTAMERISGNLPSSADAKGVKQMFESLQSSLAVKDYADAPASDAAVASGSTLNTADYKSSVTYTTSEGSESEGEGGTTGSSNVVQYTSDKTISPWIIAEDNIAYLVAAPSGGTCSSKQTINSKDKDSDATKASCVVIVVDVNGLSNTPNRIDEQYDTVTATKTLAALTGDRFYIFIGSDGATAGSKKTTISGRIAADLK